MAALPVPPRLLDLRAPPTATSNIGQVIDAQRKTSVAAKPSAVRTACSAAHFSNKARLFGPALAGSAAMSIRFVGMMPSSV
jgi:hypothetical protein